MGARRLGQCIENFLDYKVIREIGRGARGVVYLVEKDGKQFALKTLLQGDSDGQLDALVRFRAESAALSRLSHPGIVGVNQVGEHAGTPFIVMEFLDAEDLKSRLVKGPLAPELAIDLSKQLASALHEVHRLRMVHRDLKPDNVIFTSEKTVKLIDFGMVADVGQGFMAMESDESEIVGTLMYSSPEQAGLLKLPINETADLYSLGVVMYEMVIGKTPFSNAQERGNLLQLKSAFKAENINSLNPQLPFVLGEIICKLLECDPAMRYQSAKGLLSDLEKLAQLEECRNDDKPYQLGGSDRRINLKEGPMVGRQREFGSLINSWEAAQRGVGSIVLIEAESGVGKTRLAAEVMNHAVSAGGTALGARCNRIDTVALAPVFDLLKLYFSKVLQMKSQERDSALAAFRRLPANTLDIVPTISEEFAAALGLKESLHDASLSQEARFEHLMQILIGIGGIHPGLILLIDDIHWLDESTVAFLNRFGREVPNHPLLLIMTARSGEDEAQAMLEFRNSTRNLKITNTRLAPLESDDAKEMISNLLGGAAIDDQTARRIAEPTGRVPFAIREYLLALVDSSVVTLAAKGACLDDPKLQKLGLSLDAGQLILNRVKMLSSIERDFLSLAAISGSSFNSKFLRGVLNLAEHSVQEVLDSGVKQGLIEAFENGYYTFTNERIRDAFIALRTAEQRAAAHDELAKHLIKAEVKTSEMIGALAHHFMNGTATAKTPGALLALSNAVKLAFDTNFYHRAYRIAKFANDLVQSESADFPLAYKCKELYAIASFHTNRFSESIEVLNKLLPQANGKYGRAKLNYWKAKCVLAQGRTEDAWELFLVAFRNLGNTYPRSTIINVCMTLFYFARVVINVYFPFGYNRYPAKDPRYIKKRKMAQLACEILEVGGSISFLRSTMLDVLHIGFRSVLLAEQLGPTPEFARADGGSCVAFSVLGFHKIVERKFKRAFAIAREKRDDSMEVYINFFLTVSLVVRGQLDRYDEHYTRTLPLMEKFLSSWHLSSILVAHTSVLNQRGWFLELADFYEKKLYLIDETKNLAQMTDFRETYAGRLEILGRFEDSERLKEEAHEYREQIGDSNRLSHMVTASMVLQSSIEKGEFWKDGVEEAADQFYAANPSGFFVIGGYILVAQLRLGQYQTATNDEQKLKSLTEFKHSVKVLCRKSKTPLYDCQTATLAAALARIEGNFKLAARHLERAEDLAAIARSHNGAYFAFIEHARLAQAKGQSMQAAIFAKSAQRYAKENGWVLRLKQIESEFGIPVENSDSGTGGAAADSALSMERAMAALLEISAAASKDIDPVAQGRSTLDSVTKLLGAERACIFLGRESQSLNFFLGRTAKAEDIQEIKGFSTTVVRKVFEERKPMIITGTDQGEAIGSKSIVAHNLKSIMVVPLVLMEDIKGVIYLDSSITKGLFSEADLDLLVAISTQIASSIHISELAVVESERQVMKKDLELSASVQKMFLPQVIDLQLRGLQLAGFYRPAAQCGGDWWWYRMNNDKLAIAVGDVTGHGAGPAMITATVAASFKLLDKGAGSDVGELIAAAHKNLIDIAKTEYAMSMFGAEVDQHTKVVKFWSAGAPHAFVLNKSTDETAYLAVKGGLMGMEHFFLGEGTYEAKSGDRIFIFSDGIVEMKMADGRQLGERRLSKLFHKHKASDVQTAKRLLIEELDVIRGEQPQDDDFTFVFIDVD